LIRSLRRSKNENNGNVAIISLHKLGDTIFTIPAIKEIQKRENNKITIVCFPESIPIFNIDLSSVDYCEIDHRLFSFNGRFAKHKARKLLEDTKPEIIYDVTGVITSATLIFNSRAKKIIGINSELFKTIYDHYSPVRKTPHLIDMYLDAVHSKEEFGYSRQILNFEKQNGAMNRILIHPFAGWRAKEWSFNNFIKLALKLKAKYNVCLLAPRQQISSDIIKEIKHSDLSFEQPDSMQELIRQIRNSSVFVGNDSGPVYIASLLGKHTFTIFGPTNPDYSASIGDHHEFISKSLKCSPSSNNQYCYTNAGRSGCPAFQCMDLLEIDEVYENLVKFLVVNDINKRLQVN
jgi:ADP-heptose:LPS heptosyltransferase